jgi:hypothetical protein
LRSFVPSGSLLKDLWISIEDALPKPSKYVLTVYVENPSRKASVSYGYLRDLRHHSKPDRAKKWELSPWGCTDAVSHWMPLPEAPKWKD